MSSSSLRVLTLNTASFNDGPLWYSTHCEQDDITPLFNFRPQHKMHVLRTIEQADPDIVCLQESVLLPYASSKHNFGRELTPPRFSLDDSGEDDDQLDNIASTSLAKNATAEKSAVSGEDDDQLDNIASTSLAKNATAEKSAVDLFLERYDFMGKCPTHADYTALFVKKNSSKFEVVSDTAASSVGGESDGSMYNFPACVLRLRSAAALVAVTSVHMTPFNSAGGARRSSSNKNNTATAVIHETRREAQLRRTAAGLLSALEATIRHLPDAEVAAVKQLGFIIAGDTNMRDSEVNAARELQLLDAHDFLRCSLPRECCSDEAYSAPLSASAVLTLQQLAADPARFLIVPCEDEGDKKQLLPEQLFTWDTFSNRFNGQGPSYRARYDRVYIKTFAVPESTLVDAESRRNILMKALEAEAAKCMIRRQQQQQSHVNNKQQQQMLLHSPWMCPASLRLVAHKPIIDPQLDAIDAAAFAKFRQRNDATNEQQEEEDELESARKPSMFSNDAANDKNVRSLLSQIALDEAQNEHAGPVPTGGRLRYLSDHFGVCVDFAFLS